MRKIIIGVGHRKRTGKDTFCKLLSSELKTSNIVEHIVRKGFADKIKEISHSLYSWAGLQNREYYIESADEAEEILPLIGKSPRQIWIEIGSKFREIYINTWIDYLLQGVNYDILIIPDTRFITEINRIKDAHGIVIRIDREEAERSDDVCDSALQDFDDWDMIIDNNGTLEDLQLEVLRFIDELLLPKIKEQI